LDRASDCTAPAHIFQFPSQQLPTSPSKYRTATPHSSPPNSPIELQKTKPKTQKLVT